MDYQKWLGELNAAVTRWGASPAFSLHHRQVEPPVARDELERIQKEAGVLFPADLEEFYSTACGKCDVTFGIDLNPQQLSMQIPVDRVEKFGFGGEHYICSIQAGLKVVPPNELLARRRELRELLYSWFTDDPDLAGKLKPFHDAGLPLSETAGGAFLIYLGENDSLSAGIYLLDFHYLMDAKGALKFADSLADWLRFLESSCYVGPEWTEVIFWHDGERLVPNAAKRGLVLQALGEAAR